MRNKSHLVFLLLAVCLLALRLWHIRANFPDHHFYFQDQAWITDEGFYTGAALNHFLFGHTYLPGGGAQEISLLSGGIAAMDSDGTMPLAQKLNAYRPGWFMDWTNQSPARRETVAAHRRMVERATFPDLDRFRNAGIVLYQIFPRGSQ